MEKGFEEISLCKRCTNGHEPHENVYQNHVIPLDTHKHVNNQKRDMASIVRV